jgi:hypothetical protein
MHERDRALPVHPDGSQRVGHRVRMTGPDQRRDQVLSVTRLDALEPDQVQDAIVVTEGRQRRIGTFGRHERAELQHARIMPRVTGATLDPDSTVLRRGW